MEGINIKPCIDSSRLSSAQLAAYPELEPFLLKGVRKTADCKRLGYGSFGVVDQLYVQGTLCAAKQLHTSLLDSRNQGVNRVVSRFVAECRMLSSVRHPNIVQFLGLHLFPNCSYPTLVMEQLAMSLEDLLCEAIEKKEELPFSLKVSILSDTAKGLIHLHNHSPQIIHRDLTSRNVLLTLDMQAKITDLGNALIIDSHTVAQTMTQTPGTAVYMPPEAIQAQARYNSAIDMFSYGHLSLYMIIQEFPKQLLAATFNDEITKELRARSEIQRRVKYIDILNQKLGNDHVLTQTIERCLDNVPDERPSALQVLENLEALSRTATNGFLDDFYLEHQHVSKLDLIKKLASVHHSTSASEVMASPHQYVIAGPIEKVPVTEYLELCGESAATLAESDHGSHVLDQSDKIKIGIPGNLKLVSSKLSRTGSFRRGRGTTTRKEYTFKIVTSDSTNMYSLVYYEEKSKKTINLVDATNIQPSSTSDCSFEISLKGKEDPLKLVASSKDECDCWVKALKEVCFPSKPQPTVSQKRVSVRVSSTSTKDWSEVDLLTHRNKAYNYLPPPPDFSANGMNPSITLAPTLSNRPVQVNKPVAPEYQPVKPVVAAPAFDLPHHEVSTVLDDSSNDYCYDYIKDDVLEPKSTDAPPSTGNEGGDTATKSTKALVATISIPTSKSTDIEDYTKMQSAPSGHLRPASDPCLPSPESPFSVIKALNRLSRFNSEQMEHLIEMLKMTVVDPSQTTNNSTPGPDKSGTTCTGSSHNSHSETPPPRPPKPSQSDTASTSRVSTSNSNLVSSRERPSQLSLSMSQENVEQSTVYVNTHLVTGGRSSRASEEKAAEKEGESGQPVPTLVVESTDGDSTVPVERRKSEGLLTTTATANAIKFKLARLLSESDGTSNAALLVTGESPDSYEERPDWAKASTGTTPVHSPLPRDDHLSLLRQKALFMQRSALHDLEEIGEGQFGKVYKATLVRDNSEKMTVAVKTIKKYKSEQETSDFLHEMSVMMDLMHPNIIHLYGMVQQDSPWLVLQYLPNGDLKNYLINNKRSVDQLIHYMIDVAMGMHYIMEKGLVHRDLAARNVMVDIKETCKVADFGLLREIPRDNTIYQATTEMPWPIRWMAPESLDNREFSPASDIWSFGVLLWEMYYPQKLPYAELNNLQIPTKVLSGYRLSIPSEYPSTVASIMKACWQRRPEKRPSFVLISTLLTNI